MNRRRFFSLLAPTVAGVIVAPTVARKYFFAPSRGWRPFEVVSSRTMSVPLQIHPPLEGWFAAAGQSDEEKRRRATGASSWVLTPDGTVWHPGPRARNRNGSEVALALTRMRAVLGAPL